MVNEIHVNGVGFFLVNKTGKQTNKTFLNLSEGK